ncbi:hypothetical protein ACFVJS_10615 [Nocardioides sp. NPDC057772]|uniref:hypothetical protein n=1 Tax=unclassified Nocardioides TaxID=2615069 RepID=UPI0002028C9E|nr:hypothetical protein [Nocardioides sp. NBC_00368]EGD42838.1 hypothetical protein NBCG_02972 [Nocardioidaceae bacterium Broad-1]
MPLTVVGSRAVLELGVEMGMDLVGCEIVTGQLVFHTGMPIALSASRSRADDRAAYEENRSPNRNKAEDPPHPGYAPSSVHHGSSLNADFCGCPAGSMKV